MKAFTLIETLVATAVLAVLSICVLTVIAHVARADARRSKKEVDSVSAIERLIARDLRLATSVAVDEHATRLRLEGNGWIDSRSQGQTGRTAMIEYAIESAGESKLLIRRQSQTSGRGATERDENIVTVDADRLTIETPSPLPIGSNGPNPPFVFLRLIDGRELRVPLPEALQ